MEQTTLDLAESLRVAVGEFVRAARRHEEISGSQLTALGLLDREGPATIAAIAAACQIRHQSATKVVNQLEAAGSATLSSHPSDGRAVQISITERGKQLLGAERLRRAAWIAQAIESTISSDDREQIVALTSILQRLAAAPN